MTNATLATETLATEASCAHCATTRNMHGEIICRECGQRVCRLCENNSHMGYSYATPHWICPVANPL
jgi:hypothetical protein